MAGAVAGKREASVRAVEAASALVAACVRIRICFSRMGRHSTYAFLYGRPIRRMHFPYGQPIGDMLFPYGPPIGHMYSRMQLPRGRDPEHSHRGGRGGARTPGARGGEGMGECILACGPHVTELCTPQAGAAAFSEISAHERRREAFGGAAAAGGGGRGAVASSAAEAFAVHAAVVATPKVCISEGAPAWRLCISECAPMRLLNIRMRGTPE